MHRSLRHRTLSICLLIAFSFNAVGFSPYPRTQSYNPSEPLVGEVTPTPSVTDVSDSVISEQTVDSNDAIPTDESASPLTPSDDELSADKKDAITIDLSIEPKYLAEDNYLMITWAIAGSELPKSLDGYQIRITIMETQAIQLQQLIKETDGSAELILNDGCERGCILQADLLDLKENVIASSIIPVQRAEIIQMKKEGGQIASKNGKIEINFTQTNLSEDTNFYIIENTKSEKITSSRSGHPFEIIAKGNGKTEEIRQFKEPFEIVYHYDEEEYGGNEVNLSLVYYDESAQTWSYLPSSVDTENNLIIAQSDHLTILDTDVNTLDKFQFKNLSEAQTGSFTGGASYTYPITVPEGSGGLKPSLAFSYSSTIVDGATSITQGSWVGMGWNLDGGSITTDVMGTVSYLNDVYSLNLNGASGTLIPYTSGTTSTGQAYVDYQIQNANYWRIRRLVNRNSVGDGSIWQVWDKVGNQYTFEPLAHYSDFGTWDHITLETWKWCLTRVKDH